MAFGRGTENKVFHKENCVGRTRSGGKKDVVTERVQGWKVREGLSEEGLDEEEVCVLSTGWRGGRMEEMTQTTEQ